MCPFEAPWIWSRSKDEALSIIVVSKLHSYVYDAAGITDQGTNEKETQPAKTKSHVFRLTTAHFSDELSLKFLQLGKRKDNNVLDCGLAANDDFFGKK